jgi:hypothetical protein
VTELLLDDFKVGAAGAVAVGVVVPIEPHRRLREGCRGLDSKVSSVGKMGG